MTDAELDALLSNRKYLLSPEALSTITSYIAALRAERDAHHDAAACVRNDIKEMQRNLGAAERERDALRRSCPPREATPAMLDAVAMHSWQSPDVWKQAWRAMYDAAETCDALRDAEAAAFAAGMRRAAEVCQNGGADWAYDLIREREKKRRQAFFEAERRFLSDYLDKINS